MAESIYTQLENQTIITPVNGQDIRHELPSGLFPDDKTFESPELLIAWAKETGHEAKLIQKGIQKAIIEVRATFKSSKKDEVWSEQLGQDNLDALEWKSVDRPNQGGSKKLDEVRYKDCLAMIVNLSSNGMKPETIRTMVSGIYDEEIIDAIFETLNLEESE